MNIENETTNYLAIFYDHYELHPQSFSDVSLFSRETIQEVSIIHIYKSLVRSHYKYDTNWTKCLFETVFDGLKVFLTLKKSV